MILPEHLPDETLASLWARQTRLNGYSDGCAFISALLPNRKVASFIDTEIHFPSFCKAVGNAYGTAEEVTKAMTNLHAQVQIGELDLVELREIENGDRILRLGDLTFFGTTALSYCRSCVTADIAQYGISYWHRLHQLPVMLFCSEHGDRLSRFVFKRSRLHESFPLPGDVLVQANTQEAAIHNPSDFWLGIAGVAAKLFDDPTEPCDSSTICEVFLEALRLRGLVTAGGKRRSSEFEIAFKRYLSDTSAELHEQVFALVENPGQLVRGITDASESRSFARVMLVHWLFGEWSAFKEKCRWSSILGRSQYSENAIGEGRAVNALPDDSTLRAEHRQVCMDYVIGQTNPTRLEFLKAHYRSFRWLLHRDRSWLDAQLPLPARQGVQFDLFE